MQFNNKCPELTNYRLPKSETLTNNNISQHEDVIKMQFNNMESGNAQSN